MYNETLGQIHFWATLIFFNMIFFVQHFLRHGGDAAAHFRLPADVRGLEHDLDLGAFGMGLAQVLFFYIVVDTIRNGKPPQLPWKAPDSLEWTHLPTPVPYHTFETQPVIK